MKTKKLNQKQRKALAKQVADLVGGLLGRRRKSAENMQRFAEENFDSYRVAGEKLRKERPPWADAW